MTAPVSARRRRVRRAILVALLVAGVAALVTWLSLGRFVRPRVPPPEAAGITSGLARAIPDDHPRVRFTEATAAFGLEFLPGGAGRKSLLPEDMGSGAALVDLDGDGDLDLFAVGFAGSVGSGTAETAKPPNEGPTHRLFRNDGGRFVDVTAGSGVDVRDFGIGVAAGDIDGDGLLDLYVTAYGPNRLFRNRGGLRFDDVTAKAGVGDAGFGSGAAFSDVDRDGDLDLYVGNYVVFRWDGRPPESSDWGGFSLPYTINPSSFPSAPNRFYRNRGDGSFEEVAAELGIDDRDGRTLGAVFADFNGDAWPDLYVLNDVSKNAYFESVGNGRFVDRSVESFAADYRGAMGNAVADFDGDGDLDLFITHWIAQENGFYKNLRFEESGGDSAPRPVTFSDEADVHGLGQISLDYVGWGTAFFDYDLDGWLDLAVVNGSTMESEDDPRRLIPQRSLLFWQKPKAGYFEVGAVAGAPWKEALSGRGLVDGDLDGDGDLDLVITSNHGPLRVFRNEGGSGHHWLRVRVAQPTGNRFAIGAQITVVAAGRTMLQEVGAGTSYLCQRPFTPTFGLGAAAIAERVLVRWPDGSVTEARDVRGDREILVTKDGGLRDGR